MPNPKLSIEFDITEGVKKAQEVKKDFNLQGLLKAIGLRLHSWVSENFKKEGGLVGGWKSLAESTIRARLKRRGGSGNDVRILQDTGRLRMSFDSYGQRGFKLGLKTVEIGSNVVYARFQHEYSPRTNKPARPLIPTVNDAKSISVKLIEASIDLVRKKYG